MQIFIEPMRLRVFQDKNNKKKQQQREEKTKQNSSSNNDRRYGRDINEARQWKRERTNERVYV